MSLLKDLVASINVVGASINVVGANTNTVAANTSVMVADQLSHKHRYSTSQATQCE